MLRVFRNAWAFSSSRRIDSSKFCVRIGPGAMALTRIAGASSIARVWVRLFTAALAAAYGPFLMWPPCAARDDVLMIEPPFFICLAGHGPCPNRFQIEV